MDTPRSASPRSIDARADALWRWLQRVVRSITASASVTTATTLTGTDGLIVADATAGAFAVNLPPAADAAGVRYDVKKVDASGNTVTVTPDGAETIDGAATYPLTVQYQSVSVRSDGTTWWVL